MDIKYLKRENMADKNWGYSCTTTSNEGVTDDYTTLIKFNGKDYKFTGSKAECSKFITEFNINVVEVTKSENINNCE